MGEQDLAAVEMEQKILRAAADAFHPPPLGAGDEVGRQRQAQVRPALLDAGEAASFQRDGETAPHGLDLGQFRHGRERSAGRADGAIFALDHEFTPQRRRRGPRRPTGSASAPVAAEEKAPLVRAVFEQRRVPLRPDERPDERRHPPLVEVGDGGLADRRGRA